MRTALLFLVMFAMPALATQTVWKWVDAAGVTHYSDRPTPGATRIELSTGTASDSPASIPRSGGAPPRPADIGPVYRNFEIWKPASNDTLVNTGGEVNVNVRVDPPLQSGHNLHLYLDGRLVEGFPENTLQYNLKEVSRGTHSVTAVINDARGKRIQEAGPVQFNVRQESIAQPPVGPALRPPPKPQRQGAVKNKLLRSQPSYAALNGQQRSINPATNLPIVPKPASLPKPAPVESPQGN